MLNKRVDKNVLVFSMFDTLVQYKKMVNPKENLELGLDMLTNYLQVDYPKISISDVKERFYVAFQEAIKANNIAKVPYSLDDLLNNMVKAFGKPMSHLKCVDAIKVFFTVFVNAIEVNKETYDILKTCKDYGYKIVVLDNSPYYSEVYQNCFEILGLNECIDKYFFSYEYGLVNINSVVLEDVEKSFGVIPCEIIMIANELKNAIQPASKLGWDTLWINIKEEDNYLEIENLKEISKLMDVLDYVLFENSEDGTNNQESSATPSYNTYEENEDEEDYYDINNDI